MAKRLLVVGAGMATAFLLRELDRLEHGYAVTVIGDEPRACYNRVLLSSMLAGEVTEPELDMLPGNCAATLITGTRVERIDTAARCVHCDDGSELAYDTLVIATGSSVATPDIALRPADNLHVVRTIADVNRLRSLPGNGRAVVLGGGLLGLEAAAGLNKLGFETVVLHRNSTLMNRQLDAEGGACLRRMLEERGIHIITGVSPLSLRYGADGLLTGVELDSGEAIDCDLLVIATGIRPRASLASDLACAYEKGILVDARMETSVPGVFALGECCQFGNETFGLVAPVRQQAEVLARTLCGETGSVFEMSDWPVQLKISDIDIFRVGDIGADAEQIVVSDPENGVYRRLALRSDRVVGAILVGDSRGSNWYTSLVRERDNVATLRPGLMFGREVALALRSKTAAEGAMA